MANRTLTMDYAYAVTPFVAWLFAGGLKFLINSAQAGQWAFGQIGYGGMPSNHSAIVSSTATLIALREGMNDPSFGVAMTLAFIVILDASSLRRQVGKHAKNINILMGSGDGSQQLRERMGHKPSEVAGGCLVGLVVALIAYKIGL